MQWMVAMTERLRRASKQSQNYRSVEVFTTEFSEKPDTIGGKKITPGRAD